MKAELDASRFIDAMSRRVAAIRDAVPSGDAPRDKRFVHRRRGEERAFRERILVNLILKVHAQGGVEALADVLAAAIAISPEGRGVEGDAIRRAVLAELRGREGG